MPDLPKSVRYVKNGEGGKWWPDANARSRIHAGWSHIPDEAIRNNDIEAIASMLKKQYGTKPGATQDLNALRALLEQPSQHMWVTFEDGCLWWATARDGLTFRLDNETEVVGHFWLDLDRPWTNRSLAGRHLALSDLPGTITTTTGFQGTLCKPGGWRDILRVIADEPDPDAAKATEARLLYEEAVGRLVARLRPKDFELLVDLVLTRSGWSRLARIGGATEGIDIEVENPAIGEIAFVQVKGKAGQQVLDDYTDRFLARRNRYARMIFAVHTPTSTLHAFAAEPIQVWDGRKIAELVVRLGLGDWVASRI